MALEYQKLEVASEEMDKWVEWMSRFGWNLKSSQRVFNRSSRPTGAISYENLTYIHSEMQVVDFTELLFERDKNMDNYYEICEFEQEALTLLEYCTERRPIEPPIKKSYEEWFNDEKPYPFKIGETIIRVILTTVILSIVLVIAMSPLARTFEDRFVVVLYGLLPIIPISIFITKITGLITRILTKNSKNSKYYKKYQSEYQMYSNANDIQRQKVVMYDRAQERLPEIMSEVQYLL